MSCLALSLQPTNGPDILLQTREWFPPARALTAFSAFRATRIAFASGAKQPHPSASEVAEVVGDPALVGDDPLAASSGQVIVGVESRYRVVYRLVNSIYVLGVTTADDDDSSNNVFECISIVNQAVSIVVTACRGVDVTPEKLGRKYAEVYMALDIVLRGVSSIRLASMLGFLHGDSIAKMVHSSVESEYKVRGADNWVNQEVHSIEHEAGVGCFSSAAFELPPETYAAGDEVAVSIAPAVVPSLGGGEQDGVLQKGEESSQEAKDPFAASEAINKPEALVGDFKKDKDVTSDLTMALVGLEVTPLPPAEAAQPRRIAVEGFEGDYGGIEFSKEEASLRETFEGFSDAFGGGLDASEFVGTKKVVKKEGLGGLELLQTGADAPPVAAAAGAPGAGGALENLLVQKTEMKGPEMYVREEIRAEFQESLLARVGLMGVVYLKTLPPKTAGDKETEFSFRIDGTTSVKRVVMKSSCVSSLGNGMFHVRTPASEEPLPIMKYTLQPRLTPIPLRVRLVKRHSGTLLSVMIQYVSNPDLPEPLTDVTFILKLPVDPTLLQISPKAVLNRSERELRWHVNEIPLKGTPGKLRVRMPVEVNEEDIEEELEVSCLVKFSIEGSKSLSGVSLWPAAVGMTDFYVVNHKVESGVYMCN